MAITETNPVVVGYDTEKPHYDTVFDNTTALKQAGTERDLGGEPNTPITDTSFVTVPGAAIVQIDGTKLGGFTIEVHVTGKVDGGTATFRLWDITAGGAVGGTQTFTNTGTFALAVLTGLDGLLPAAVHQYRLEVKGASAVDLPVISRAKLVLR